MSEGWLTVLKLLAVLGLVALNGFFVGAEFSLVALRRSRLEQMVEEGVLGAKAVQRATNNLSHFIAATQLGVTLASLALGWLGEPTLGHILDKVFDHVPSGPILAVIIAFTIITALHIVMGELVPKSLALQYPSKLALFVIQPLSIFEFTFRPAVTALSALGRAVVRTLGLTPVQSHELVHSPEELKMLVEASGKAGVLEESEREIIDRAFDFADYTARELMVPRTEVKAVPADMRATELLHTVVESGYSRYPVYDGSLDQVVGIVHVKDLLAAIERAGSTADLGDIHAGDLARKTLLVPETLDADEVLAQLRATNARLALVIDEFGGFAGVVTLENLLEQLVGQLRDEFEPAATEDIIPRPDGSVSVKGRTRIEDANELLGLEIEDPENESIGGYVFSRIGHLPRVGDAVEVNGHRLEVEAMDGNSIERVLVVPHSKEERGEE